jgi:hypothetical protein
MLPQRVQCNFSAIPSDERFAGLVPNIACRRRLGRLMAGTDQQSRRSGRA